MSKVYTFRTEGYNPANDSCGVQALNGKCMEVQYIWNWAEYGSHEDQLDMWGPAYFVSEEFDYNFEDTRTIRRPAP